MPLLIPKKERKKPLSNLAWVCVITISIAQRRLIIRSHEQGGLDLLDLFSSRSCSNFFCFRPMKYGHRNCLSYHCYILEQQADGQVTFSPGCWSPESCWGHASLISHKAKNAVRRFRNVHLHNLKFWCHPRVSCFLCMIMHDAFCFCFVKWPFIHSFFHPETICNCETFWENRIPSWVRTKVQTLVRLLQYSIYHGGLQN